VRAIGGPQARHNTMPPIPPVGLDETPARAYLSANRTCEMGLRQATGRPYQSFVSLPEEVTR
jgi:hypothetical protein